VTPITGIIEPPQGRCKAQHSISPASVGLASRSPGSEWCTPLKWLLIQPRVGDSSAGPAETTVGVCGEALDATSIGEEARDKADIDLR